MKLFFMDSSLIIKKSYVTSSRLKKNIDFLNFGLFFAIQLSRAYPLDFYCINFINFVNTRGRFFLFTLLMTTGHLTKNEKFRCIIIINLIV